MQSSPSVTGCPTLSLSRANAAVEDGRYCCILCSLLTKIQNMVARLDSESDHRFPRFYQDLQEAAQSFWITPQEMNHHFSTITAYELSAYPTPIMSKTTTPTSPAETPAVYDTLPPIIPPSPENADPRDLLPAHTHTLAMG